MLLPAHAISLLFLLPLASSVSAGVPTKRQIGFGFNRDNILRLVQDINNGNKPGNTGNNPTVGGSTGGATGGNCPPLQIFGARETTAPPGFGTAGTTVDLILSSNPGSAATAIDYPACGGQDFCGGVDYAASARAGTLAVAKAVNDFNAACPQSMIVLVGYSQGGQVSDNAFCGGGDQNIGLAAGEAGSEITAAAKEKVVAAIFMGSPRFTAGVGASANVGSCTAQGFAPRPAGFVCPDLAKVQSYCDAPDPFCCNGNDQATHQGYGNVFGQDALAFVNAKIAAASAGQ